MTKDEQLLEDALSRVVLAIHEGNETVDQIMMAIRPHGLEANWITTLAMISILMSRGDIRRDGLRYFPADPSSAM